MCPPPTPLKFACRRGKPRTCLLTKKSHLPVSPGCLIRCSPVCLSAHAMACQSCWPLGARIQLILCTDEHCSDTRPWQGLEVDGSDTCVDGLVFSRQSYVLHMLSKSYQWRYCGADFCAQCRAHDHHAAVPAAADAGRGVGAAAAVPRGPAVAGSFPPAAAGHPQPPQAPRGSRAGSQRGA